MSSLEAHEAEQAEITAAWQERNEPYQPRPHAPDAPRWYVTLTWDNWPEGGSYGAVVQADDSDDAEHNVRWEMAGTRVDDGCWEDEAEVIEAYGEEWHVVDCFKLDDFIAQRAAPAHIVPAHSGHDPDGINDDRAEWAEAAVLAFMRVTGTERHDAVSDLIADLLHLAHKRGESFADDLDRAFRHFANETCPDPDMGV